MSFKTPAEILNFGDHPAPTIEPDNKHSFRLSEDETAIIHAIDMNLAMLKSITGALTKQIENLFETNSKALDQLKNQVILMLATKHNLLNLPKGGSFNIDIGNKLFVYEPALGSKDEAEKPGDGGVEIDPEDILGLGSPPEPDKPAE